MINCLLYVPDQHADPDHPNDRADYLAGLTIDLQPDVVINGGDAADMASLSTYDKGKRSFVGKSYKKDIDAHLDFQSRWWEPVKRRKKKLPLRIVLEGNHEHRVERTLDLSPELVGTVGFNDFDFDNYYDEVIRYDGATPGQIELEGILFAHYFPAGVMGRPTGGVHPGATLLAVNKQSSVACHSHLLDWVSISTSNGLKQNGLIAGCYQDYNNPWAGKIANMWKRGVCVLRNVEKGNFDLQWISIEALKKTYGN